MRHLDQSVRRHDAGREVAEAVRLPAAPETVGKRFPVLDRERRRALLEAVLQFLLLRHLGKGDDRALRRDVQPVPERQIFRRQVLQKDQASGPVGDGMEELRRDPVLEIEHSRAARPDLPGIHIGERIGEIGHRTDRRVRLFQIIPEESGFQTHKKGWKTGLHLFDGPVQDRAVHVFGQRDGNPEHIVPAFSHDRGKNQSRVIQSKPLFLHEKPNSKENHFA